MKYYFATVTLAAILGISISALLFFVTREVPRRNVYLDLQLGESKTAAITKLDQAGVHCVSVDFCSFSDSRTDYFIYFKDDQVAGKLLRVRKK